MGNCSHVKKREAVIYIFFALIAFCKGLGLSSSSKIYIIMYIFGIIMVFLKISTEKYTYKELIPILILFLIGIVDLVFGGVTTVLFTAISLCCLKDINIKQIVKIMLFARMISFLLLILLSTTGIVENNVILHYRNGVGFINRYSLGYEHPNLTHSSFSIIVILFGYLYYRKINLFYVFLIEIFNYILYSFTVSRTGFMIISIYLIFLLVVKNIKFIRENITKIINVLFIFFIFISFVLAWGYGKIPFFETLNSLLTGRINYMSQLLNNYSVPLIGRESYGNILFDNGYFSILYEGGLLASIWYFYYNFKVNKYIKQHKLIPEALLSIFFMFYCIFESYYMNILMNPCLFFIAYVIFTNRNEKNLQ